MQKCFFALLQKEIQHCICSLMSSFSKASILIVESGKKETTLIRIWKGKIEQKLGQIQASSEMNQHPTQSETQQQQQQLWEFQTSPDRSVGCVSWLTAASTKARRWSPAATSFARCVSACLGNAHLLKVLKSFWLLPADWWGRWSH